MRNPRTFKELLADPRVEDGWWEIDGYGDTYQEEHRPSLWIALKPGWLDYGGSGLIHTKTVKKACERIRDFNFDPSRA